jgi:hypothetical protein
LRGSEPKEISLKAHVWTNEEGAPNAAQHICLDCMTVRDVDKLGALYLSARPDATDNDWTDVEPACVNAVAS